MLLFIGQKHLFLLSKKGGDTDEQRVNDEKQKNEMGNPNG